jgi:methyl-accepting chemotaxis protein
MDNFDAMAREYTNLRKTTKQQVNLDQIANVERAGEAYRQSMINLLSNWKKLDALSAERGKVADEVLAETKSVAEAGVEGARKISHDTDTSLSASSMILIIGLIVALALGIVISVYITRMIVKPVTSIADIANAIAKGDLSRKIEIKSGDEIGKLAESFRQMSGALQGKAGAADEIANGNLAVDIQVASNEDVLGKSMVRMVESLQNMNSEVQNLTNAALEGQLDTRADVSAHKGDYAKLVGGINELFDAIVAPIQEGAGVLKAAASKDLTQRVQGSYKGQLADLKNNINTTVNALDAAMQQVGESVEQVTSASDQISSGSQSLAQGANEQASALEEISSSLEEMSSMTKQNADNANQAKSLSESARDSADKGSRSMTRMTDAIGRIKTSSDETAKIVKTIDEIAFQTNLLALNAAVEAARAGEAGKGFAVVAEEVRNLAQRSAEAAKNTAAMIEEAVKNAEDGVSITDEVAAVLTEIVTGSTKVNDLVAEISAAASEQAQGIEQVNNAVSQMDQVTQQNASNSEESASAAEELNSQAVELNRMVNEFVLSRNTGSAASYQSPRATAPAPAARPKAPVASSPKPAAKTRSLSNRIHDMVAADTPKKAESNGNGTRKTVPQPDELIPLDDVDMSDF